MIRLFVDGDLTEAARITIGAEPSHYLTRVMRQAPGAALLVFNGRDGEWRATLAEVGKRGCVLVPEIQTRSQATAPDLELFIAMVKRARLETIVEKAAELGVRRVRLVLTERTNADHTNIARLTAIATEASEQTGRLDVPTVVAPQPLSVVLSGMETGRRLMFCDEGGEAPPVAEAMRGASVGPWAVLIGPEGGFSPAERAAIRGLAFALPVSLGPRILRADTAAIAALSFWQSAFGDWRGLEVGPSAAQVN